MKNAVLLEFLFGGMLPISLGCFTILKSVEEVQSK